MLARNLNDNNAVLIDEFDINNIRSKLLDFFQTPNNNFKKYEKDIFWEDKEQELISIIEEKLSITPK